MAATTGPYASQGPTIGPYAERITPTVTSAELRAEAVVLLRTYRETIPAGAVHDFLTDLIEDMDEYPDDKGDHLLAALLRRRIEDTAR
jgi:hypothetical protein